MKKVINYKAQKEEWVNAQEKAFNHLRKILTEAVKIDSTAFRGLS